jgi:nucleotide-binding universal stress UspA family protein
VYPWRRILVPTDFSTAAKWAFDDAIRAAVSTGAEVLILHVRIASPAHPGEPKFPFDPEVYDYVERHELEVLRRHAERAHAHIRTRLIVRVSADPGEAIIEAAEAEDVDLVVLSTHGHHLIGHRFVGSTTMRILGSCRVPVLAVRYGIRKRTDTKRLVLAGASPEATALAAAMAGQEQGTVETIAGDDLAKRASESGADVVIVPSQCAPDGALTGDAEEIIRKADAPVLIVPAGS